MPVGLVHKPGSRFELTIVYIGVGHERTLRQFSGNVGVLSLKTKNLRNYKYSFIFFIFAEGKEKSQL